MSETLSVVANGQTYAGWSEISVGRGLSKCVSHFDIAVTERWAGNGQLIKLLPFTKMQILIGNTPVLTGYVDTYRPGFGGDSHAVRIAGRSVTEDLVDCMLDIPSGQFNGYTLAAIAASVANVFATGTIVQTALANAVITDATIQRSETAFDFLDRLATLSGVLLTDDASGNLVMTTAGSARATGRIVQGENIESASATITSAGRFSQYIVKGQVGVRGAAGAAGFGAPPGTAAQANPAIGAVQTQLRAVALDKSVPRYRPHVTIAQGQLGLAAMQTRANWQAQYALGRSLKASFTVPGWTQPDGTLWTINTIVTCDVPFFGIDDDLLILEVTFNMSADTGRTTDITVGPIAGATPSPALLKQHKTTTGRGRHGRKSAGINWSGVNA